VRLAGRISAGVALLLLASGGSIGALAAAIARSEGIASIDARLDDAVSAVAVADDPVSALLERADRSAGPSLAWLYFDDADPIALVESASPSDTATALAVGEVDAASRSSVDAGDGLRIRSVSLGDGEWLVVAESRTREDQQFVRAVRASVAAALAVALVAAAIARVLVRRTLEPVRRATESASRIASGELDAPLPVGGAAEIGELAAALARMVEALRAASDAHRESERRMREFLGDASHELRTPMTVITGYVDVLAGERPVDESQRARALARLRTEASRMEGIIRDLLMLAEMDAVRVSLDDLVDLGELTAEHVGDLMDQQPDRPVTLACSAVTVLGSRPHLARLLANLASNIQRHTDVTAAVTVTVVRELGDAVLTIDDAGPGLPVAMYERAATGFERFDRSRSTGAGGFGLGLGMVAAVVRLHGGSLTLSRSPLGGLRTVVRIPVGGGASEPLRSPLP